MQQSLLRSASGFTLVETVVATGILVTALAGLAQLFILSARLTEHSSRHSTAAFATQAKMESLLSFALTYGLDGVPVTDPAVEPSPPDTLSQDVDGFAEALDGEGRVLFADETTAAVYARRWAITPLDDRTPEAFVIEVCVFRAPAQEVAVSGAESCLATIRSRQP